MRTSVERLRIWLLVGAGLLVLVIAGFLGYARYRMHRALENLPGRMGATITKEFDGYTYSQSDGKRTIFTVHASKAVQHTDGKYALHDVNMILYGHKGDRADHISGDDFEYDTANGVIRAQGVVLLDLEAPVAVGTQTGEAAKHLGAAHTAEGTQDDARPGSRVVHVKTSGLVYMQKLGIAATDQGIDFAFGGFTGHAIGAEYSSDTGHVVLQSAVTASGVDHGHPVHLEAAHGELDRQSELATLTKARYNSAGDTAEAETARIHLRSDGTVEGIEAERSVRLEQDGQGAVTCDHADLVLNQTSKPTTAVMAGNVVFSSNNVARQERGNAARANLNFDARGQIDHAVLQGGAHVVERLYASDTAQEPSAERTLSGDTIELSLAPGDTTSKPLLRAAHVNGNALLTTVSTRSDPNARTGVTTNSRLSANLLDAHFVAMHGAAELSTLHGIGHTLLDQRDSTGLKQASSGDTLDARLREKAGAPGVVEIASATQDGNIVIDRTSPAKTPSTNSKPEVQHGVAKSAAFDADSNTLALTGDVRLSDESNTVWASRLVMNQDSGNATAEGGVKVNYVQDAESDAVHVVSARAEFSHDNSQATFYGNPAATEGARSARLWQAGADGQSGSQIEAPVIVLDQDKQVKRNRLTARAGSPDEQGTVHTVLVNGTKPGAPKRRNANSGDGSKPSLNKMPGQAVIRIVSSMMVYSDLERQADFTGGIRVLDGDGDLRARQATVFLSPVATVKPNTAIANPKPNPPSAADGLLGGKVERLVATRDVELLQTGRQATGDRLVYTAADQMFVLTGTQSAPPKVIDAQQGTTTGASLRFHSGDNSVMVSGSDGDLPARRVRTETKVKQ